MSQRPILSDVLGVSERGQLEGASLLDPPAYDAAIIGIVKNPAGLIVAVYDYDRLVQCVAAGSSTSASSEPGEDADDESDPGEDADEEYDADEAGDSAIEEAEEWVNYNTLRALPYMGERAPIVASEVVEGEEWWDMENEDDLVFIEVAGRRYLVAD